MTSRPAVPSLGWRLVALLAVLSLAAACGASSRVGSSAPSVPRADGSSTAASETPRDGGTAGAHALTPPQDGADAARRTSAPASSQPAAGPEAGTKQEAWNVLLITVDAMRADMPWNGYPRDIAPHLTELAKHAVSYPNAYAISSYTAMSVGGFLSGRYPSEMQRSGYFFSAYPDSELMFPELLQAAGVRTLAAHAHFYFDTKAGFRQGFDDYRMVEGLTADNKTDRNVTSGPHLELALRMLGDPQNTSGRFFAWFHFMDPHDLYVVHPDGPSFGKRARDRYDGEIAYVDRHIGRLLEFVRAQPWGKRTVVIVNSDHGEAFGEHDRTRHGFELWEPLVHVPLLVQVPGGPTRTIETPRSMIDLAPTILELLGVEVPKSLQGHSLVPEISTSAPAEPRAVVIDLPRTSDNDRRRALVWGQYKLIAFGDDFRFKLFDLSTDPGEERDLRKQRPELYREMRKRYDEISATIHDICPTMRHKLMGKHASRPC